MRNTLAALVSLLAVLWAPSALPCGSPFGAGISVDSKQDIIIAHRDGVETYVFQPTFCGTASDFGLILPIPSTLAGPPGLSDPRAFRQLETLSNPQVIKQTQCRSDRMRAGTAGGMWGIDRGTTVVSSGQVGFLDWVQLKADSEASFTSWLDANRYPYSSASSAVFAYYVQKGWYFVAFKINQGAAGAEVCKSLGPVKLSFATPVPVIPSRMATAGDSTSGTTYGMGFTWRIFGISPAGQELGFLVEDPTGRYRKLQFSGPLTTTDGMSDIAVLGDRLTRLALWFDRSTSTEDIALALHPAKDFREIQYDTTYVDCGSGCSTVPGWAGAAPWAFLLLWALLLAASRLRQRARRD